MSETGEIAFDQAIADLSRIEKSASNIQAQVAELFPEEQQSQMAAHLVEFFPNPGHLLDKIKELGKEIINLNGTISDLKGTISGLEGTVSGLKGKVSDLESKVTSVGKQLASATKSLSELSNNVLEDAKKVEHRVVDFGKKLEGLEKDFSFGSEDGKKFVALLKSYYEIAMQAIQTLIKALESDIQNLVNIDRLTKLWNIVEIVFDQLPKVGSLVVGIAKDAEKWTKTVFTHVQEKWKTDSATTKAHFLSQMNGFKASMESIAAVHLPIKLDEIFDAKTFSSAMSLIEVIPESIWAKATSFLNLSYFDTFGKKVSEMADLFDPKKLASDAKSAQSDASKAAEIVVAMGKSYTSWLKIAKQTFKIKINAKLLDYLKAKVTGGGDFGAADADVDGDSGAGLTLGVDVFSISGTVIGLALLVLALVMAVVHLLIDIY